MRPFEGSVHPLRPLFAVAHIQLGRMLQPARSGNSDRAVAYLRASNVQEGRVEWADVNNMFCPPNDLQSMSLAHGDLLVCEGGDVGRVALLDIIPSEPTVFQNSVHRIVSRAGVEPRFIFYALQSLYKESDYYSILCNAATIRHLTVEKLRKVRVPVPSFEEQRRIADFLDDQVALLDHAAQHRRTQIDLLAERRSSLLEAIFGRHEHKNRVLPLRRVVSKWIDYRGATPIKTTSGVPLVTAKNVRGGKVTFETSQEFITAEDYDTWMRRGLPIKGDVLLTTEAPLGEVAQIEDTDIALAQRVILLRADQVYMHARWLYWYLRSPQGQSELWQRATGTTAQGIKAARLRELPIPVPALDEQLCLLLDVERADGLWDECIPLMDRSAALMVERKQALITAAVTGQFDVTTASKVA
jgi:type I restriction enzyme S subunit